MQILMDDAAEMWISVGLTGTPHRTSVQGYEVIPPTRSMIVTRSGATVTCGGGGE